MRAIGWISISAILMVCCAVECTRLAAAPPNIVLIYTDDVGFGDVAANGSSAIPTPNIDRLAKEGLRLSDAHSSAATCTASRFALLTGRYAFRQKGTGILAGNANLIISPGTVTLPGLLKQVGYRTGVVGKWHLGLGEGEVDWNAEIAPGPAQVGFDYHFLIPATGDRVPCVYVEQGRVVGLEASDPIRVSYRDRIGSEPSGAESLDSLKQRWSHGHNQTIVNGISRIGWMTGGQKARWVDEDMADVITRKATEFVAANRQSPFFLMFSTHDIHVPRVAHPRFAGKSGHGLRGDVLMQLDASVGALLDQLDSLKLTENTLVIFTSDNGPVLDDGYVDAANESIGRHDANGPWRAGKYSRFEGATRVPFLVRYPARIAAGQDSAALFGQVDLCRSLASLAGVNVPADACRDSRDELDTLLGQDKQGRPHLIHEAGELALRKGQYKFIPGGKSRDGLGPWQTVDLPKGGALYDLSLDPAESRNIAADKPQLRDELASLLEKLQRQDDR